MEHWSALPAREPPLPDESLASLLRRTAIAMGYENVNLITRLLGPIRKPHQNLNQMGTGPHWNRLAVLLQVPPEVLCAHSIHSFAPALVLRPAGAPPASQCDNPTTLRYFLAQTRSVCIHCLAADPQPYERLIWSFRPLRICTRHGCALIDRCPTCGHALAAGHMELRRCRCGVLLTELPTSEVSEAALTSARALECWLRPDAPTVAGMPSAARFWWAERLALAIAKIPGWRSQAATGLAVDGDRAADLVPWAAAAQVIHSWPDGFFQFLEAFQQVPKDPQRNTGVGRSFGPLLREAAYLEDLGYPVPAEALRHYLLERFATGHLNRKIALFREGVGQRCLHERRWCTQTQAAALLQMQPARITQLLRQGVLQGEVHPAGNRGRTIGLVSQRSVASLREVLVAGLRIPEVSHRLGVGTARARELIHSHLLGPAIRTHQGWRVSRDSVQALEEMIRGLPALPADRSSWLPVQAATRIYGSSGLTLTRVLEWVQSGQVAAATDHCLNNVRSLWLLRPDLDKQLPALRAKVGQQRGFPLVQLEKALFPGHTCCETVLRKWIRAGLLRARRPRHAWVVPPEEVERFRREYCLAAEARAILQVSADTLLRWQQGGRLTPVSGPRHVVRTRCALFRRVDVQGLRRFRAPARRPSPP